MLLRRKNDDLNAVRGIINGIIIAIPFYLFLTAVVLVCFHK